MNRRALFFTLSAIAFGSTNEEVVIDFTQNTMNDFDRAVIFVRTPSEYIPTQDEQLQFYGLYKQATLGPCNASQPWIIQIEARAKWDAWNKLGNMSMETARSEYISLLDEKAPTWRQDS